MAKFWDYVRKRKTVDKITDRWANITIVWGGPPDESSEADRTVVQDNLMVYFDDECAFAMPTITCAESKTYAEVVEDFEFLVKLFRTAQRAEKARR